MKPVRTILAATTVLVIGGGLFAAQAIANPTTPAPLPVDTATRGARGAGQGVGWLYAALTDEQRTCLADAALQRPEGKLTDAQRKDLRAAIDAALAKCEVTVPPRLAGRDRLGFRWAALTPEQQQCLADVTLNRPAGRLTKAERATLREARVTAIRSCVGG